MRKPSFIQIMFLLLFSLFFLFLHCHASDQLVLLSIRASITDNPLRSLSSWNDSISFCLWQGVTCSRRHSERVTELDLSSFGLAGTIPPSIANLTFLQRINFADNHLHGHIPQEVGSLRRLLHLNLSSNSLDGEIPATLSHCPKLRVISLRSNKLNGAIPHNLSNCLDLQIITLKDNKLTGEIPVAFGGLPKLLYLDVASNNLTGIIPSSLGNISSLLAFEAFENSLSGGIPPSFRQLSSLVFLRLHNNSLTGSIPSSLANLSSLNYFRLSYNNFTGELPTSMGNLSSLVQFDVTMNMLSGPIPPSFGRLSSLTALSLTANSFSGSIPPELGSLSSLSTLALSHNNLAGEVPPSIYNLSAIQYLGLSNNELTGALPLDIGQSFPRLQIFYIYFNHFHGQIPASLANATGLQDIELTGNNFTGKIPASLGTLQELYWLSLDRNQLEAEDEAGWSFFSSLANCSLLQVLSLEQNGLGGALPRSVGNLSNALQWLSMGGNQLTGTIPAEIGNLVNLTVLGLDRNFLDGSIPSTIGKLQMLNALYLSSNKLSGAIPGSIGNLSKLTLLTMEVNSLEGAIPASLGGCQSLGSLDLSYNKLTGSIPKEVLSLSSLTKYLDLSHNLLSGSLPPEVGRLRNLRELDVESNDLSGEIPSAIGECEVLEILLMNGNRFEGIIPKPMSNLKGIQELDLASNNLSGSIPEFLAGFSFLQRLNLSFNDFEGPVPAEGVFRNVSAVSLQGNEKLCGDPKLNLSPCSSGMRAKRDGPRRRRLGAIISASVCALFVLIAALCLLGFWYRSRRNVSPKDSMEVQNANVSYFDILRATDGFSSSHLIGAGAHGSVYKGTLNLGEEERVVAIKVLNLQQKGALKSFAAECNALKAIRHRNLIKIITSCSSVDNKGSMFRALIFPYMANGSLEEWLHSETRGGSRLGFLQRIKVAIDIASALEYLHHHHGSTPVVHCDLKPSNVLLDDDMTAHVSDFGLAKLLGEAEGKSSQASSASIGVKGTVGYAAPEYGVANQVSIKGDIYSYGLLLLEMFTGKRPTDESFGDGRTLRSSVEVALSEQVLDVIDPCLLTEISGETPDARTLRECLILTLEIGLACSKELPKERIDVRLVLKELHTIRSTLADLNV